MKFNIEELIDTSTLSQKIHYLYTIMGINIKVYNNEGIEITRQIISNKSSSNNKYRNSYFLNRIINKNDKYMKKEIINCNRFIIEKLQNGLCRIIYDIIINSTKLGYIVSDYFFMDDSNCFSKNYTNNLLKVNNYRNCDIIKYVPVINKNKLALIATFAIDYLENVLQSCYLKHYDELTGFYNRENFIHKIDEKLKNSSCMCTILILYFYNIKIVNGTYGYEVGNLVIKEAADRINLCIKDKFKLSILARRNDEIGIFIHKVNSKDEIRNLVKDMYTKFEEPIKIKGIKLVLSFSTGIDIFMSNNKKAVEVIKKATAATYIARKKGKNKYCIFEDYMYNSLIENESLSIDIRSGFYNNEFEVYYQPLVDTYGNGIYGAEALLRWNNPDRGIISPSKFIPSAEESNFIITLGKWVLQQACFQCKKWHEEGYGNLTVSVNVSQKQLQDDKFINIVREAIQKTNLNPKFLCLEITETVIMKYPEICIKKLEQLKKIGIKIALDDFGTGYSSLNYLKNIPFDVIKIDKSFIDNIPNDKYEMCILEGMLEFMKKINKDIIIEGIENFDQLEFVQKNECYKIQGYLISKPQNVKNMEALLIINNK